MLEIKNLLFDINIYIIVIQTFLFCKYLQLKRYYINTDIYYYYTLNQLQGILIVLTSFLAACLLTTSSLSDLTSVEKIIFYFIIMFTFGAELIYLSLHKNIRR